MELLGFSRGGSEILGFGAVAASLRLEALVFKASSWNSGFPIGVPLRLLFRDPSAFFKALKLPIRVFLSSI